MTSRALTPYRIKEELAGTSFTAEDLGANCRVAFEFPSKFVGWPRQGSEGYVMPVTCKHPTLGNIPSIFKYFLQRIPDRAKRFSRLVEFGLSSRHDLLYQGVPYAWIDKEVAGYRLFGHVTKHVCHDRDGDDFGLYRNLDDFDNFTVDNRRQMAGHLCNSIHGLETLKIKHGDLSARNIVVGRKSDDDVHCILIDYDGFEHPDVPRLPRQYAGNPLRMLGSIGYQHPSLMRQIASDDGTSESIHVVNDRFPLGVLCFELMTWTTQISNNLNRDHLLDQDALKIGKMIVPKAVEGVWPAGYALLKQAVEEPDPHSLPSPEDWLKALGFLGADWRSLKKEWASTVVVKVFKHRGNLTPLKIKIGDFDSPAGSGSLSKLNTAINGIDYLYRNERGKCEEFTLTSKSGAPVILKRDGRTIQLGRNPDPIMIWQNDKVITDGWIFEFQDASLGKSW